SQPGDAPLQLLLRHNPETQARLMPGQVAAWFADVAELARHIKDAFVQGGTHERTLRTGVKSPWKCHPDIKAPVRVSPGYSWIGVKFLGQGHEEYIALAAVNLAQSLHMPVVSACLQKSIQQKLRQVVRAEVVIAFEP